MSPSTPCFWPAPAKLNLFLHVTGRRPDGYHELQTLFQLLDWGDRVRLAVTRDGRINRPACSYGVEEADDLTVRAARLLQSRTGSGAGVEITVDKRIPPGSGLGGGSSDAATVLLVLNRLWDCGLGIGDLAALGAELGADVPVFVLGRSALAAGIGERLEAVALGRRHYVIVFPPFGVSTSDVFSDPDLPRDSPVLSLDQVLAGKGRNDCERVVRRRYPELDRMFRALTRWGRPLLTGTGSGIFIEMTSEQGAIGAAREMKTLYNVRAVCGVDRSALHVALGLEE
jgi:4-diphosphocytidyl-2-C-methyl-D-erythritol kinase